MNDFRTQLLNAALIGAVIVIAVLLVLLLLCKGCGSGGTLSEPQTIHTTDTIIKKDTVPQPFPVYKYKQVPKFIAVYTDTGSVRTDTITIDSVRTLLNNVSFIATTDTMLFTTVKTEFGTFNDTMKVSSTYLFPANTASFEIRRNDFNYERLIQTIINNTKTTYVKSSFWSDMQYVIYGAAAGYVAGRVIK